MADTQPDRFRAVWNAHTVFDERMTGKHLICSVHVILHHVPVFQRPVKIFFFVLYIFESFCAHISIVLRHAEVFSQIIKLAHVQTQVHLTSGLHSFRHRAAHRNSDGFNFCRGIIFLAHAATSNFDRRCAVSITNHHAVLFIDKHHGLKRKIGSRNTCFMRSDEQHPTRLVVTAN